MQAYMGIEAFAGLHLQGGWVKVLLPLTKTMMEAGRLGPIQDDSLHLWGCQDLSWSNPKPRAKCPGLRRSAGSYTSRETEAGSWALIHPCPVSIYPRGTTGS